MDRDMSIDADLIAMFDDETVRCRMWPEQDEGPYHLSDAPSRRDVVEDRAGVPLRFAVRLMKFDGSPAVGATAEVWHCDAIGRYSGFPAPGADVTTKSTSRAETPRHGEIYLRGAQPADHSGTCEFRTIYPGWYPARTVHIHLRVHHEGHTYTSQLYFPDALSDAVLARAPYRDRPGRDTKNSGDELFAGGGEAALLQPQPDGTGYKAAVCFTLGNDRPRPASRRSSARQRAHP
jgi:protocatechuate 3,4-dioxygenase beta subunit